MIIMNCCDYCWELQPPPAARRLPFAANYFPQTPFAPDYVYNPKEARIRKAMRDQANRARAVHQQNQRQQQHIQQQHQHHHQAYNRQHHPLQMEARNEIINRTRLSSLPRQTSSSNIQSSHKISHLLLPPHVLQHKPSHIQLQQVNHGIFNEGCNQQWMLGLNHRPTSQHPQQDVASSQEHDLNKTKASIRDQVEQGIVDGGYDLMDVETMSYPTTRAVEVAGSGASDGLAERPNSGDRGGMSSQIAIPNGQEFTVFTDIDGHQHWYPCVQADDIKVYNGGSIDNSWSHHQEHSEQQMQQHHLQHENLNMKIQAEQQQLFPLQCLVGTETSIQGKAEQTANYSYQRIVAIPSSEMNTSEEESLRGQQYFICSSATPHPQVKFSVQPQTEVEDTKENPTDRESTEISITDGMSSAVKTNNMSHPTQGEMGQRNPDLLPLPAFQQAFGSTEIGRFANEGFLSQSPETPSWSDPISQYGLPSPSPTSKPAAAFYYSFPRGEEMSTTHPIPFPHSITNYFDCAILEDIDGPGSGYGDLLGLAEAEGPGFDLLTLHVPSVDNPDQDGEGSFSAAPGEIQAGLASQESNDLTLLTPLNTLEL